MEKIFFGKSGDISIKLNHGGVLTMRLHENNGSHYGYYIDVLDEDADEIPTLDCLIADDCLLLAEAFQIVAEHLKGLEAR